VSLGATKLEIDLTGPELLPANRENAGHYRVKCAIARDASREVQDIFCKTTQQASATAWLS
jgi:hypothetical protein